MFCSLAHTLTSASAWQAQQAVVQRVPAMQAFALPILTTQKSMWAVLRHLSSIQTSILPTSRRKIEESKVQHLTLFAPFLNLLANIAQSMMRGAHNPAYEEPAGQ